MERQSFHSLDDSSRHFQLAVRHLLRSQAINTGERTRRGLIYTGRVIAVYRLPPRRLNQNSGELSRDITANTVSK